MRVLEVERELREEVCDLCGSFVGQFAEERLDQVFKLHGGLGVVDVVRTSRRRATPFLLLDLLVRTEALALDEDGLGMVQQTIEQCRGECAVVVEDLGPGFVGAV